MQKKLIFIFFIFGSLIANSQERNKGFLLFKKKGNKYLDKNYKFQINKANKVRYFTIIQVEPIKFDYFLLNDYDGDGIPDIYDQCPATPGIHSRFGCPEVDHTKLITYAKPTISIPNHEFDASVLAFANLTFHENKISEQSSKDLHAFVKMLHRKVNYKIVLSSYVDLGNKVDNYLVSKERLNELKRFLINKGISSKRIKGLYFGDTMPVVDLPLTRFEVEIDY